MNVVEANRSEMRAPGLIDAIVWSRSLGFCLAGAESLCMEPLL
jgi:hypothetical protein